MPNTVEIHRLVFDALAQGRLQDAEPWQDALLSDGKNAPGLTLLGRYHAERGDITAGLAYTGEASRVDPFYAEASIHRGNMFVHIGNYAQAADCFESLLLFSPLHNDALNALINALRRSGRNQDIVSALRRRILLGGENHELMNRLGLALHGVGDLAGALANYRRAVELSPETPLYYSNMATIYYHLEQFDEALVQLDHALRIDPNFVTAWYHTGNVLKAMRKIRQAEEAYRKAVEIDPNHAESHFSLGCTLLQQDKWAEGWGEYEWRWNVPGLIAPISIDIPCWQGEDLTGRKILVVAEQGSGDSIQYIRYASTLEDLGAEIYVWAPPETAALMRSLRFVKGAATNRFELPRCDFYVPTMSLPRLLHASPDHIPSGPYITPDPHLLARFSRELGPRRENLRIGISWAGNSIQVEDKHRSAQLSDLEPLLKIQGVRWIGLQKGPASAQIAQSGLPVEDWGNKLESFHETAGLICALDGVVSVCSAPIHLAGALGVRSVALLAWSADWRWREDDVRTPYYPSVRIARMSELNDWAGIAKRTAQIVGSWKANTPRP
jgi:tetratricopeptide (TPR) repeat protein